LARLGAAELGELARRGLSRGGWNYSIQFAKFYLNKLLLPARRASLIEGRSRQYIDRLTREGWVILGSPLINQPRVINEADQAPSIYSKSGGLWHPRQLWSEGTIPSAHPWVRHGEDLVFIRIPAKRPVQPVAMEIPDEVIKQWQDARDPILQKLVVAT
jgi:hypothetical protein